MKFNSRGIISSLLIAALLLLGLSPAQAAERALACSASNKIQDFLPRLRPGDTLKVSGTCNENISIGSRFNGITLDGQGAATINGTDATANTIAIRGTSITITGFQITGGSRGIIVNRGGSAIIDGNTIHNTGSDGVQVSENSTARILNNTIQTNPDDGIVILDSSSANIGFMTGTDTSLSPNTIQNNGGNGVNVGRGSAARVAGNTISGNSASGILVNDNSTADTSSNVIDSNGDNGIQVVRNSSVRLGRDNGVGLFDSPNSTSVNNTGAGVRCRLDGTVDGQLGTLNGTTGATDLTGCTDSTIP
jgi:hypothetical protein